MQLSANLDLSRYDWATQKVRSLNSQHFQNKAIYYDVGAGENELVNALKSETGASFSFDLEPYDSSVEQWDIETKFPYSHPPANIVTFLEIVEHLNNPWLSIKNVAQVLAPGGFLVLTTPNPGWSTSRINLLAKGVLACFSQSDLELNHHVFTVWPHILERLLADNGFEIVEYVTLDGSTRMFAAGLKVSASFKQIPARFIKKIIEKNDATSKGMSYGVVARKIDGTA